MDSTVVVVEETAQARKPGCPTRVRPDAVQARHLSPDLARVAGGASAALALQRGGPSIRPCEASDCGAGCRSAFLGGSAAVGMSGSGRCVRAIPDVVGGVAKPLARPHSCD